MTEIVWDSYPTHPCDHFGCKILDADGNEVKVSLVYPIYSYSYRAEENAEEWTTRVEYRPPPPPPLDS